MVLAFLVIPPYLDFYYPLDSVGALSVSAAGEASLSTLLEALSINAWLATLSGPPDQ